MGKIEEPLLLGPTVVVIQNEKFYYPLVAWILWLIGCFGFCGLYRCYVGRVCSGCLWFFTAGCCGIGWLLDIFCINDMVEEANRRANNGPSVSSFVTPHHHASINPAVQQQQQQPYQTISYEPPSTHVQPVVNVRVFDTNSNLPTSYNPEIYV